MASRRASRATSGFPPAGNTRGGLFGAGGGGGQKTEGGGATKAGGKVGGGEKLSVWIFLLSSVFLSCSSSSVAPDLV